MSNAIGIDKEFEARMDANRLKDAEEIKNDPKRLKAAQASAKKQIKDLSKIVRISSLVTGKKKKTLLA